MLGQWLNQTEYQTVFRWTDTLAVTRNTTYEVKNPAIQQVLTDFGESLYWEENSDLSPGVSGFCFYSDGSLTHYLDNELQISGSYRGLPQVNSAAIPFTITLGEWNSPAKVNPFKNHADLHPGGPDLSSRISRNVPAAERFSLPARTMTVLTQAKKKSRSTAALCVPPERFELSF